MSQRTQNLLIHILLLWTTVISIIQIVIIILFFTAGHKGSDSSAVEPPKMSHEGTFNPQSPSNNKLALSDGKMLTFKASEAEGQIKWTASRPDKALISEYDKGLTVKADGYYFLNLQVTLLSTCIGSNNHNGSLVKIQKYQKVLLEGLIHKETGSTGILSKVEELGTGETLVVNITAPSECVDYRENKTHLDIIFMLRPPMSVK